MTRLVTVLMLIAAACTPLVDEAPLAPTSAEAAGEYVKPMLPVYETAAEKAPGKADQYDDFKNANLDVYGVTAAPGVTVRPAAEWEPVHAMLLAYNSGLPGGIKKTQVDIIAGAKDVVDIFVIYENASDKSDLQNQCAYYGVSMSGVQWLNMNNDTIWMRDFGPISIMSQGKNGWLDNRYYPNRVYDDATPTLVGDSWSKTVYRTPVDMEGGNFMCDTQGTCFHTESIYWANATSQANVDQYFSDYFGCTDKIVVAKMDGEGTGHIDMSHKIVTDSKVIVGEYGYEDPTNKQILDQNAQIIAAAGFDVVRMPMPSNGGGIFRSYTNSLLVNGVNLWPTYSVDPDLQAEAAQVYQQVLPGYTHVPILSDEVITWAGAIHCVTMTSAQGQPGALEAAPAVICDEWDCYPGGGGPAGCGDVTYEGCCEGDLLQYCEGGQLKQSQCDAGSCGWDAGKGFYNCGTNGGGDPSGQHPKDCGGGCQPACAGKECGGDGCGGSCGTCPAGEDCVAGICEDEPCQPACAGKECGGDGCGGSCGACPAGEGCDQGQCVGSGDACGGITYEGCCDGDLLQYCADGELGAMDCTAESADNICGWFAGDASNPAGYYCGPAGAVSPAGDPTGTFPLACPGATCTPDCAGKACGDDGCGGACGTCAGGLVCAEGACACQPDCGGKQCGDDGCGGLCGTCPDAWYCDLGACVAGTCDPVCEGRECGGDGCGALCGTCADGVPCLDGVCTELDDLPAECPEGTVPVDGECVDGGPAPDEIGLSAGDADGSCNASGTAPASGWVLVILLVGLLSLLRRRSVVTTR